jgi:hypothetical protein
MAMTTATREDFFALYKRCIASGLLAHVGMHHSSGLQNIYSFCSLSSPSIANIAPPAKSHHLQRHDQAAAVGANGYPSP